jgi:hypothetical protein
VLHTVPSTFIGVAATMAGIHWSLRRREQVAAAEAPTKDTERHGGAS